MLDQTIARDIPAVKRGEMADAEAVEDLTALTVGMLTIKSNRENDRSGNSSRTDSRT